MPTPRSFWPDMSATSADEIPANRRGRPSGFPAAHPIAEAWSRCVPVRWRAARSNREPAQDAEEEQNIQRHPIPRRRPHQGSGNVDNRVEARLMLARAGMRKIVFWSSINIDTRATRDVRRRLIAPCWWHRNGKPRLGGVCAIDADAVPGYFFGSARICFFSALTACWSLYTLSASLDSADILPSLVSALILASATSSRFI